MLKFYNDLKIINYFGSVGTLIRLCKYWSVGAKLPFEFEGVSREYSDNVSIPAPYGGPSGASKPDGFCESDIADAMSDTLRALAGQEG